jgi:hypothetical protein
LNVNKLRAGLPLLCAALLWAAPAGALDFGLAFTQEMKTSNEVSGPGAFFYTPVLSPWFSAPLGKGFSLYLSGSLGFGYTANFGEDSAPQDRGALPELGLSELAWRVSPSLYFRLGRQRFQDPSGLVAAGLFDGLNAGFSAAGSRFSLGAFYTGLLYKNTADIVMTRRDKQDYEEPFHLGGEYAASRRALASFSWERPGLGRGSSLALGLLGQFDLNGDEDWLHSQYLSARYGLRLPAGLELQADAALGLGESPDLAVFFGTGLGLTWTPPGLQGDRLNIRCLYSSPSWGGRLGSFIPVSSVPQGQVFSPSLTGISVIRFAYTLRVRQALALTGEASYFIRTDTSSFQDSRAPENLKMEGYFLGGECYGTALWTPLPDLALAFGGGVFFPHLGNAFMDKTDLRWKAAMALILSL